MFQELLIFASSHVVLWPQVAAKNHTVALLLLPPPWWDEEENEKEKAKLMGRDENSLTEWQREKTVAINNTDYKNIQLAMFSPPNAQLAQAAKIPKQLPT